MAAWYADGRWDAERVRSLFIRALPRSSVLQGYSVLALDRWVAPPPAPPEEVEAFEAAHGIDLPPAFRDLVLQVGDGLPAPYGALLPISGRAATPLSAHLAAIDQPFPYDAALDLEDHHGRDPDDEDYWEGVTRRDLPGVLPLIEEEVAFLVVTGPRAGEIWVRDESLVFPGGPGDTSVDLVAWYGSWLDELDATEGQLVPMEDAEVVQSVLREIDALATDGSPAAATRLAEIVEGPDEALGACALRALGRIDPESALGRARAFLVAAVPGPLDEAALDVFVAGADGDDLPLVTALIEREGPYGAIPMDSPRRVALEGVLHRFGDAGMQAMAMQWLSDELGRPATQADVEQLGRERAAWEAAGTPFPPPDSPLLEQLGYGTPTPEQQARRLREAAESAAVIREALGGALDPAIVQLAREQVFRGPLDELPPELREEAEAWFGALEAAENADDGAP
jgi:hypothetical protein